jgi:hypothetical protein
MAVFWVVAQCSLVVIALMMEAASISETSVNFYQTTWRNNPEDCHIHTRLRENLKSHQGFIVIQPVRNVFLSWNPNVRHRF